MKFTDYLNEHVSKEMVSFHMPGHKGRGIFDIHGMGGSLDALVDGDITEIPGSDNLAQPEGIIRSIMDRYKALYGSEETFISVGGSSLGIMASILAVSGGARGATGADATGGSAMRGATIAIARNSHKSVFNGLSLAGAQPIYIYPELPAAGIAGEIKPSTVEAAFMRAEAEGLEIAAVVVPNPNYYGICSDINAIAEITRRHGAILIVDQAHGAHLRFLEPRLDAAADIVIESTHKTLATFTQTAIINVYNPALVEALKEKIKILQTTSPSYMLMKSLDMNAELIEKYGEDLFESWRMNLDNTYAALDEMSISYFMDRMHDRSKILIDMREYGLSGADLSKELFDRGIVTELDSGPYSMCMTGIGNSKGDYERLIAALTDIKATHRRREADAVAGVVDGATEVDGAGLGSAETDTGAVDDLFALMNKKREMGELPTAWEWKPAADAAGLICAESIIPYPPGVPLIAAGEVMDAESLAWAEAFRNRGGNVLGMNEHGAVKAQKTAEKVEK